MLHNNTPAEYLRGGNLNTPRTLCADVINIYPRICIREPCNNESRLHPIRRKKKKEARDKENLRGIKTEDARRHCIRSHSPRGRRNAFFIISPYLRHSSGFSTDALANDVKNEKKNRLKNHRIFRA